MNDKPNILFMMTDHQRADSLGMIQAGVEVTPNLNRLAEQSTVFTRAYNTCPLCVPARTALATGKYPTHNGVVFNDWRGQRAGDHKPIHQYLAEAGYHVAHIGIDHIRVNPGIRERVPFVQWVDNVRYADYLSNQGIDDTPAEGVAAFKREVFENQNGQQVSMHYSNTYVSTWPHSAEHFKDSYFCQQAIEFLNRTQDRPFALFLYLWAPHPPLRVPEPYASLFDPTRVELPRNVGQASKGEPANRRRGIAAQLAEGLSLEEWRTVWAAHLGLVNLVDAGIGEILATLDSIGQADTTIVLFASDHGDHLGQHNMYQKMEMYEQAIRVPFLIRVPGVNHQVFDHPVSHLDIMPTLLECADIELPDDLDGDSLWPSIRSGTPPTDKALFCQYSGNPTIGDIRRAVITRRYKDIYDPEDEPELYDLEHDPLEMQNLASSYDYKEIVAEMEQLRKTWGAKHNDWV